MVDGLDTVVLKAGRHLAYDCVASGLARALGCNVAGHLSLSTAAGWEAEVLRVEVGRPMLRMDLIAGSRSFAELTPDDMDMLCMPLSAAGEGVFRQIGRAVALDCLTGNPDRFSGIGLDVNLGNLMLRGDQIFCIDNSLARFRGRPEDFASRRDRLSAEAALLLRLAADPGDEAGREAMGTVMAFFHGIPGLGPQSRYAPKWAWDRVIDGFRTGVAASRNSAPPGSTGSWRTRSPASSGSPNWTASCCVSACINSTRRRTRRRRSTGGGVRARALLSERS